MKKRLATLAILTSTVILSSCTVFYNRDVFFDEEILKEYHLEELPVPNLDKTLVGVNDFYCNLDDDGYASYVKDIVGYLKTNQDVYHLSYSVQKTIQHGMKLRHYVDYIQDDYDFSQDEHVFVYSLNKELGTDSFILNSLKMYINRGEFIVGSAFSGNVHISLSKIGDAVFDQCHGEHRYGPGVELPIPGSEEKQTIYTCYRCGATKTDNHYEDGKIYKINVCHGYEFIYTALPDRCYSGERVDLHLITLNKNKPFKVTVNGTDIPLIREMGDYYAYSFTMPNADIDIHIIKI